MTLPMFFVNLMRWGNENSMEPILPYLPPFQNAPSGEELSPTANAGCFEQHKSLCLGQLPIYQKAPDRRIISGEWKRQIKSPAKEASFVVNIMLSIPTIY